MKFSLLKPKHGDRTDLSAALYEENSDSTEGDPGREHAPNPDLTDRIPLRSINVVNAHVSVIQDARTTVTNQMESLILSGLETLVSHFNRNAP